MNSDDVFLFLDYEWSFGDPGSGYWTAGALSNTSTRQSKNTEYGPTAGHLYEDPGTYTVRLTVCNTAGNDCDTDTQLIRVDDPDTVYAGNATVCVSNPRPTAGVDGCPSGAKVYNSLDFDDLFSSSSGCNLDEANAHVRCLLRRGKTYTASGQVEMYSDRGVQIGAYGSTGADPVISAGSFDLFDDHANWQDWTFYDVKFYSSGGESAFDLGSWHRDPVHLALIRVAIEGWSKFINAGVLGAAADGSEDFGGVYIYEFDRTVSHSRMDWAIFGGFRDFWIAGGTWGSSANNDGAGDPDQKYARLTNSQRGFVGHNTFNQGGGANTEFVKAHNTHKGGAGGGATSSHSVQLVDNEMVHGGAFGRKFTPGPQSSSSSGNGELVRRFIVERNWWRSYDYNGVNPTMTQPFMFSSTEKMMIRNNIMDFSASFTGAHSGRADLARVLHGIAAPEDTYIYNNTVTHFGVETCEIGIASIDGSSRNTDARANLLYVTGSATSDMWGSATPSTNIGNRAAGSDPFVNGRLGMVPGDFKLASSDSVTAVTGVRRDFSGAIRTGGHTRGAWNWNGDGGSQPQPPAAPVLLPPE